VRTLVLTEYVESRPVRLSVTQRDALLGLVRGLIVRPVPGSTDSYVLRGESVVGVVRVGDLTIELRPKIGNSALFFLVSYALDPRAWQTTAARLRDDGTITEALVPLFAYAVERALRQGLLHGYRGRRETLVAIRGRVCFADQFRARTGLPLPVEVSYDDFTPDIPENQLLLTAAEVLGRLWLRHPDSRSTLARLRQQFNGVTSVITDPRGISVPEWTRLNERYRPAVTLAMLIIAATGLEGRQGDIDASAFLIDMNDVFERFIRVALREALGANVVAFPDASRPLFLDAAKTVRLRPDLSGWAGGQCVLVGDCKYKRADGAVPNADVYQMLAYLTALRLPDGLLVYAAGEDTPRTITIPLAGKRVLVRIIDISRPPLTVLAQVTDLATQIKTQQFT
jgi:5-methylcytosine-specific restriction enzyme subunit McrC